jgi:signal transduction histidine kinase
LQESQGALQRSHEELRALAAQLLTAQEEERRRISRDLHDDLNQKLVLLAVDAESLAQHLPRDPAAIIERLRSLQRRIVELTDDVRRLAYQLHPSILDDLGLAVALQSYVEDFAKRERIKVAFTRRKLPKSLPLGIASCLYRVAQEGLRNIAKHARTARASITLVGSETDIRLSIKDSGVGFNPDTIRERRGGLGIISMQERVRLVKGDFAVTSRPGRGVRIDVSVPLPERAS